MTYGKVKFGSAPHDVNVTIENVISECHEEIVTVETAICKAMCLALHR